MKKTSKAVLGILLATFIGVSAYSSISATHHTTHQALRDGEYLIVPSTGKTIHVNQFLRDGEY